MNHVFIVDNLSNIKSIGIGLNPIFIQTTSLTIRPIKRVNVFLNVPTL